MAQDTCPKDCSTCPIATACYSYGLFVKEVKPSSIRLRLDIKPISKDNCKIVNRSGRQFLPQKYKDWETAVGYMAKQQYKGKPLKGKLMVFCWFYFNDNRRRDCGNYQKSVLDALKGICYNDDSQIVDLHLFKRVIDKEAMIVEIEETEKS